MNRVWAWPDMATQFRYLNVLRASQCSFPLHIVKIKPGEYRAHVMDGREELGTFDTVSISAAIREAGGHALPDLSG